MSDEELQKYIGAKIREIRKSKGISQMELAFSIGMSMNTISYVESGKIASKIDTLNKIANQLEVSIYDFFINSSDKIFKNELNSLILKLKNCDNKTFDKCKKVVEIMMEK